ncbi:MAG: DEAD/DEAH box helicase, partial [Gemmatimonadetes bacterium]|nr:DEAD/DEAH box helicase [Gemmatimonadota bacterium]
MSTSRQDPKPARLEDLSEPVRRAAVEKLGWKSLMPVQEAAIPYLLEDREIMVQSRTGSGKTGAFVIPILEKIDPEQKAVQALVLVPTRELARQVMGEAEQLSSFNGVRSVAVYGGVGYGPQLDALRAGAQLVVGTPGRILDHLMRGSMKLDKMRMVVFDEADRMLSMGFFPDMKALKEYLPREIKAYMFSATYPPRVLSLSRLFMTDPEMLSLSAGVEHVVETAHVYYAVPGMEKERCLVRIIEIENPDSAIIFCNTKANAKFVMTVLARFGYDADLLSADLTQGAREKVLKKVYDKTLRFLVGTDVVSRGIDIDSLSHVILFDFPEDHESYIHRTGRTGRAGASGEAISLVDVLEKLELMSVAKRYGIELEARPLPDDEEVSQVVSERSIALLEAKLRNLDADARARAEKVVPLARKFATGDDERRGDIAMLLDAYYQNAQHESPPGDDDDGAEAGRGKPAGGRPPVPVEEDKLVELLEVNRKRLDKLVLERMRRMVPLSERLAESEDEIIVIAMLIEEFYQEALHAPPPK